MRTATAGQLTAMLDTLQMKHYLKVEVQNADAAWINLCTLEGVDWVQGVEVDCERVDQPIDSASVRLKRDGPHLLSASPLMEASPVNRLSAAYVPLLDIGAFIRISVAVKTSTESAPVTADWKYIFEGRIDIVSWGQDPIVLSCSSKAAWLMDTQIETLNEYSNATGVAVQTIMQEILDDWTSILGSLTLYVPSSPGWNIRTYAQDRVKLFEAVRQLALQIGWDVRFAYDSSDVLKLTLFEPARTNVTPDVTLGPSQYLDVRTMELKLDDIRNVVSVPYFDTDGVAQVESAQDTPSITKFGRRYMEIQEASTSNIDTDTEAADLAAAAVSDLAEPLASKEVDLLLFWPATLGTVVQFTQNSVHYDTTQILAVVGVRHVLTEGRGITTLMLSGKVRGAYREWLSREVDRRTIPPPYMSLCTIGHAPTESTVTFVGGPFVRKRTNGGAWSAATSPFTVSRNAEGGAPKTIDVQAYAVAGRSDSITVPLAVPPQEPDEGGPVPSLTSIGGATLQSPDCGVDWTIDVTWACDLTNDTEYYVRIRLDGSGGAIIFDGQSTAGGSDNHNTGVQGDAGASNQHHERTYYAEVVRISDSVVVDNMTASVVDVDCGDPC